MTDLWKWEELEMKAVLQMWISHRFYAVVCSAVLLCCWVVYFSCSNFWCLSLKIFFHNICPSYPNCSFNNQISSWPLLRHDSYFWCAWKKKVAYCFVCYLAFISNCTTIYTSLLPSSYRFHSYNLMTMFLIPKSLIYSCSAVLASFSKCRSRMTLFLIDLDLYCY